MEEVAERVEGCAAGGDAHDRVAGRFARRVEEGDPRRDLAVALDRVEEAERGDRAESGDEVAGRVVAARVALPVGPADQMTGVGEARDELASALDKDAREVVV